MKNIKQLFLKNPELLKESEVKNLIEYVQDLEGQILEKEIDDNYNKEHVLKSMLIDILSSCKQYEENRLLKDRYPDLYEKIESDDLVKNLISYISDMNKKNKLKLF